MARHCALLGLAALLSAERLSGAPVPEPQRNVAAQAVATTAPLALGRSTLPPPATTSTPVTKRDGADDFGEQAIVQQIAHVEPWSAQVEAQIFRTDNVALTPAHEQADWYVRSGASLSYTNRITGPFFVDFALQQYFFRYGEFDVLDFDLTRATAGLIYQAPQFWNVAMFGRYRLERITEAGLGSALFTNHVLELGAQKVWKISRGQRVVAGMQADLPLDTDPRSGARYEYSLTLAYSWRLTEKLTALASYRGAYYQYAHAGGRRDWNHIVSLDAGYDLTDWLRLGVSASYTRSESNRNLGDYRNLVWGGTASLRLAF